MTPMTSATTIPMARTHGRWVAAALLLGLGVGVVTLAGQAVLPVELNRLANSGAIWVTVAFVAGMLAPSDRTAALAGLVTLLAALAGYFGAAAASHAGVSTSTVAIWTGTALVGGPSFGIAGRWWATASGWRPALAAAALGGVYVAEGAWTLLVVPHMALAGWVSVGAGIIVALALPRDARTRVRAFALLPVLALVGLVGYAAIDRVFLAV
jgi:hypothetical protein